MLIGDHHVENLGIINKGYEFTVGSYLHIFYNLIKVIENYKNTNLLDCRNKSVLEKLK